MVLAVPRRMTAWAGDAKPNVATASRSITAILAEYRSFIDFYTMFCYHKFTNCLFGSLPLSAGVFREGYCDHGVE